MCSNGGRAKKFKIVGNDVELVNMSSVRCMHSSTIWNTMWLTDAILTLCFPFLRPLQGVIPWWCCWTWPPSNQAAEWQFQWIWKSLSMDSLRSRTRERYYVTMTSAKYFCDSDTSRCAYDDVLTQCLIFLRLSQGICSLYYLGMKSCSVWLLFSTLGVSSVGYFRLNCPAF